MISRVTNVVVVEEGANRIYFTLEGLEIGRLVGGKRMEPEPEAQRKVGGVVTAPLPEEVRRKKRKQTDEDLTLEQRLAHEKAKNT